MIKVMINNVEIKNVISVNICDGICTVMRLLDKHERLLNGQITWESRQWRVDSNDIKIINRQSK